MKKDACERLRVDTEEAIRILEHPYVRLAVTDLEQIDKSVWDNLHRAQVIAIGALKAQLSNKDLCGLTYEQLGRVISNSYLEGYEDCEVGRPPVTENNPISADELFGMAGDPVWCQETQCYGIIKIESVGRWANIPFLYGTWANYTGAYCDFEYNIQERELTLYRRKPSGDST